MTVTTTTASQTFQGNGVATAFPCQFEIILNTDINVYFVNPTTGVQTLAVLNSDYTVAGAGASSGFTVNTTVAVPTGTNLYVVRALPLTQPVDLTNQGAFFPTLHEAAFDRLCMQLQQIANYSEGLNVTMPPGLVPQPSTLFPIPQAGSLIGWNADGTALVNTGPSTGAGTISDVNIAANAAINATKINFTQPSSGQFFTQNGAVMDRVNDRLLVGGATASDGAFPSINQDWLSKFYDDTNGTSGSASQGMLNALTNTSEASASAILAGAQSKYFGVANTSCIGTSSIALANHASLAANAWAFYGEAHQIGAGGGSAYGMELDVRTLLNGGAPNAYQQTSIAALQLAAGAGMAATGQYDCGAAIQIEANPMKFRAGIVFGAGALTGANGSSGSAVAMSMGFGHMLQWNASASIISGQITNTNSSATSAPRLLLTNGNFVFGTVAGATSVQTVVGDSFVNTLGLQGNVTGSGCIVFVSGPDANIDLNLVAKGTGTVTFGTYTASAPPATGYITIKDAGGTVRKLLCA